MKREVIQIDDGFALLDCDEVVFDVEDLNNEGGGDWLLKDLFRSKPKYVTIKHHQDPEKTEQPETKKELPDGLWAKCDKCNQIIFIIKIWRKI